MYDLRKFFESDTSHPIDINLEANSTNKEQWDLLAANLCKTIAFEESKNQFDEAKMMEKHIMEKYNKDWKKLP